MKKAQQNEDSPDSEMFPAEGLMIQTPIPNSYQEKNCGSNVSRIPLGKSENDKDSDPDAQPNSDPDIESDSNMGSDGLAPPKKKLKAVNAVPEEIPLSLEENVFRNHLVTKAIFKNLDTKSLKSSRVVSKNFNNFATEILLLKQNLKIRIYRDKVCSNKFDYVHLNPALRSITLSVKLFHRLPTAHLELCQTNLDDKALQYFLSDHGHLIKTLMLNIRSEDASIHAVQHMLLHQVVNLERLFLDKLPVSWYESCQDFNIVRDNNSGMKINSLKEIKISKTCLVPTNLLQYLVWASPNLRQFKGCHVTNILAFFPNDGTNITASPSSTSLSKLHLIKTFSFDPYPELLDVYRQFVAYQNELQTFLQIQRFEIKMDGLYESPDSWPPFSVILSQLLQMSATTLEKLIINDPLGFLEEYGLQFPTFPKIFKLNFNIMDIYQDFGEKFLPSNCQITHAFPNVQDLKIELVHRMEGRSFFNYFGNPVPILSLTKLEFVNDCYPRLSFCWLEQLSELAPNVKVAIFRRLHSEDFCEGSKIIWTKLLNLQVLDFSLFLHASVPEGCMDVAFTGFREDTCKRLRDTHFDRIKSPSQNQEIQKIETVVLAEDWTYERENASILDLKFLTSLRVDFIQTERTTPYPVFLSCVAGLYAFKMCEKLKVSIGLDTTYKDDPAELAKSLETIRPYVTMDSSLN